MVLVTDVPLYGPEIDEPRRCIRTKGLVERFHERSTSVRRLYLCANVSPNGLTILTARADCDSSGAYTTRNPLPSLCEFQVLLHPSLLFRKARNDAGS